MTILKWWTTIAAISLASCLALAQEETGGAPPVAGTTVEDQGAADANQEATPDTRPLTGVQPLTVGGFGLGPSYIQPEVRIFQHVDINPNDASGTSANGVTNLSWNVGFNRVWKTAQTTAHYAGGNAFNYEDLGDTRMHHQFGIGQFFRFRRWTLSLFDNVTYFPESSFGYRFGTLIQSPYIDLNPGFIPNQSILTGPGTRVANTVVGQADFLLSPSNSLTASASWGILRFTDATAVESNHWQAGLGFNHAISARGSVGVVYGVSIIDFNGLVAGQQIVTHHAHAAYGRRITGRLGFAVSGGPQITTFGGSLVGIDSRVSWGMTSTLAYDFRNATLKVRYGHHVTDGAGLFLGANTHRIDGSIGRALTRTVSLAANFGFSRNSSLRQTTVGGLERTFNTVHLGVGLTRPLSRQVNLAFRYNLQYQTTDSTVCTGTLCGSNATRHAIGIGIDWQKTWRPIILGR